MGLSFKAVDNKLWVKPDEEREYFPLNGTFEVDDENLLVYRTDEPDEWQKQHGIPDSVTFSGEWRLDADHNLVLKTEKTEGVVSDEIKLRGDILRAGKDFLGFVFEAEDEKGVLRISNIKLRGVFLSDRYNRITFDMAGYLNTGVLTFKNTWDINKNHQIIYSYKKSGANKTSTVALKGHWEITEKDRIAYLVESSNKSVLQFRVYLQTHNLYPARGTVKYRLGVGLKENRKQKLLVLSGEWKFSRNIGLSFEMDYGQGRPRRMCFSFTLTLAGNDKIECSLSNVQNRSLGITVTFRRDRLAKSDYEYFLRLSKTGAVPKIEVGGKIRF